MKYRIVHELPGRLRLRCPSYSFDLKMAAALEYNLEQADVIKTCSVNSANWSILLTFEASFRDEVLNYIKNFTLDNDLIKSCPSIRIQSKEMKQELFHNLFTLTANKFLRRLFLPKFLAWPYTIYNSLSYLKAGWNSLKRGRLTVELLDATAVAVSILTRHRVQASNIMYLLNVSECLEEYTLAQSKIAVADALALNVEEVWLVSTSAEDNLNKEENQAHLVPINVVKKGDVIRVQAGSLIPLDGKVVSGEAMVNQASITGEFEPVFKNEGKTVLSGTSLTEGYLDIMVRSTFDESRIKQIMNLLEATENNKSQVEIRAVDLAEKLVPLSFLLFTLLLISKRSLARASAVLMVDYSCALRLALPVAVLTTMLQGSKQKIAIRGGQALEEMALADTIVFDKTGTITTSSPEVVKVIAVNGYTREKVLKVMACIEEHFPHSLATAIVQQAKKENIKHNDESHTKVNYIIAHGVSTVYEGKETLVGSHHFLFDDSGVELSEDNEKLIEAEANGYSVIYLSIDGKLAGFICLDEPARPNTARVINRLHKQGFKQIIMLTGDGKHAAARVAKECGFDAYHYELLPQGKVEIIKSLQKEGHRVVMVGDGINDSPSLKRADVSIAMQDASDIARNVADVSLLSDDLSLICTLRDLSTKLRKRLIMSKAFIMRFNTLILILASLELLPAELVALLHNSSTLAITANNMRTFNKVKSEKQ